MNKVQLHFPEFLGRRNTFARQSSMTLCVKMIGSTHGYIQVFDYMNPYIGSSYKLYEGINLTRKGYDILSQSESFPRAWKAGGYWTTGLPKRSFTLCEACLDHESMGMIALHNLV